MFTISKENKNDNSRRNGEETLDDLPVATKEIGLSNKNGLVKITKQNVSV